MQRDGQAQERAQAKLERNRRWFERKKSTFLVRAANAPVQAANAPLRAANAPYGELHTSTNSRSSDHERGEHTTRRLWSGRGPGQSRTKLRRSEACSDRSPCRVLTPPSRYAAVGRTDCEKIDRVHSTMYRPEVSKCYVALKQRKALNFAVTPTRIQQSGRRSLHAMQQIYAAICLISTRKVPRHGLDFRVSASLKSQCSSLLTVEFTMVYRHGFQCTLNQ